MENYGTEPSEILHQMTHEPFDFGPHAHTVPVGTDTETGHKLELFRIEVTGEKRLRNLINLGTRHLAKGQPICFTGIGKETSKAVSCVEILKNNYKKIYQETRIGEMTTIEIWRPTLEGLDAIEISRKVPIIHILLSLDPLDESAPGYQKHVFGRVSKRVISEAEITTGLRTNSLS